MENPEKFDGINEFWLQTFELVEVQYLLWKDTQIQSIFV